MGKSREREARQQAGCFRDYTVTLVLTLSSLDLPASLRKWNFWGTPFFFPARLRTEARDGAVVVLLSLVHGRGGVVHERLARAHAVDVLEPRGRPRQRHLRKHRRCKKLHYTVTLVLTLSALDLPASLRKWNLAAYGGSKSESTI